MSICPKCKMKITFLNGFTETKWTCEVINHTLIAEQEWEGDYYTSFECPECQEELFTNEAQAISFLDKE